MRPSNIGYASEDSAEQKAGYTCRRSQWDSMRDEEAAPEDFRLMSSTNPKLACMTHPGIDTCTCAKHAWTPILHQ